MAIHLTGRLPGRPQRRLRCRPMPWMGLVGSTTSLLCVLLMAGSGAVTGAAAFAWQGAEDPGPGKVVHLLRDADAGSIPLLVGIDDQEVLLLRAAGFSVNHTGGVRLCVVAEPIRCGSAFPVRFDDAGAAVVQYQLDPDASDGAEDCPTASRCVLELFDREGSGYADLSFGSAEPPDVRLHLPGGPHLVVGQPFEVVADGVLPADPLTVVLCQRADPFPRSCSPLQHDDPTAWTGGPASRRMVVTAAPEQMSDCDEGCVLSVRAGQEAVRSDVVEVRTSRERPVRYETARLSTGLAAAALLVVLGGWLWRRTDWSPPRAADGAAIDEADYADLDAEAAAAIDAGIEG